MIDPTELRIGNWVECDGLTFTLNHVMGDEEYEPIPLSPEVLEKCGFVSEDGRFYTIVQLPEFEVDLLDEDSGFKNIDTLFPCKYLHQLQNLYFALTGEELTYNPNQP